MDRRTALQAGLAAACAAAAPRALAQPAFPASPVRLIVTFPAGGPTDVTARALAEATSKHLGQPVVVENRPGAAGTLGYAALASAKPDGYTVAMTPVTGLRVSQMESTAWNPLKDVSYVIGLTGYVFAVVVKADAPWKTMKELAAHIAANPGRVTYGSHGVGSSVHMAMEELAGTQKWSVTHVPFKGSADMLAALVGGHVDVAMDSTGAVPMVEAGRVRVLAVFTEQRTQVWPEAPTLKEVGYGIVATGPYGIGAPAGTPPAIVKALHDAFRKGLEDPAHLKALERYNQPVWYKSSEDYAAWIRTQHEAERRTLERLGLLRK
ncbi:MAG: tripartite tricarboxylate transporter substrate binding protein [Burkholderiaceae bacterium]|nr:tripartite tricarboxylate transporter substrate binding protein [Burkholderiales bacterium]MCZ8339811.1 tripartite tricarboxylate transporter substrate binding protein [Burkholderiaceae bacterium]